MKPNLNHTVDVWITNSSHFKIDTQSKLRSRILKKYLNTKDRDICLENEPYGKPIIASKYHSIIHFNESHSSCYYGIAVCKTAPIGLDFESAKSYNDINEWAEKCCSANELDKYRNISEEELGKIIIKNWVRKEAILKSWGVGLAYNPQKIDLSAWPIDMLCDNALTYVADIPAIISDIQTQHKIVGAVAIWQCQTQMNIQYHDIGFIK